MLKIYENKLLETKEDDSSSSITASHQQIQVCCEVQVSSVPIHSFLFADDDRPLSNSIKIYRETKSTAELNFSELFPNESDHFIFWQGETGWTVRGDACGAAHQTDHRDTKNKTVRRLTVDFDNFCFKLLLLILMMMN